MDKNSHILCVVGISHKTSTISEREGLQLNTSELAKSLDTIRNYNEVEGVIIVTTCNRIEFYLVLGENTDGFSIIKKFYYDSKKIDISRFRHSFYQFMDCDATRHLFKVISGLESLVIGEYQIQNQVKQAYSIACENKSVEKILHKLLHAAFRTGKKVRTITNPGNIKHSASRVASEIIINKISKDEKIAIIGVNENTKIMAESLIKSGFYNLLFINRTSYKAEMMAREFGGEAAELAELGPKLSDCKAVFTCTGAPEFIGSAEMLQKLEEQNKCPALIIDLAVPRDFDTSMLSKNIEIYNISDLKKFLEHKNKKAESFIPEAMRIIEEEVNLFQAWTEAQKSEILAPYAEKLELCRQQLLDEYRSKFTEQGIETFDRFSRQLLHRLQSTFIRMLVNDEKKQEQEISN